MELGYLQLLLVHSQILYIFNIRCWHQFYYFYEKKGVDLFQLFIV